MRTQGTSFLYDPFLIQNWVILEKWGSEGTPVIRRHKLLLFHVVWWGDIPIVSPFPPSLPLLSLSGALCLGFLCLYTFSLSTQRRRKNQSPHEKRAQARALWASLYDTSLSVFNHQTNQIPNINFTNAARIDLPITDHLPMTEHLFISSSSVLHFEWFKMLWECYLKL